MLYADYLLEKEGKHTISNSVGFVTYKYNDGICHICVIYIKPEFRNATNARNLMHEVIEKCGPDCKALTAAVFTKQIDCTESTKILIHYGFEIVGLDNHDILLYKALK